VKPRVVIIIVAIFLGLIAALSISVYINNIKRQAIEEQKTVEVWVANTDIAKGTGIEEIQNNRMAELKAIPRRYVASQSISSTRNLEGQVLSVPVSAGEQLTANKFKYPSEAGLAFSIPNDHIAVSIPYDDVKGVAGMVKPGDLITVFVTFDPGPGGESLTKILLQKVKVIAVGVRVGAEREQNSQVKVAGSAETPQNNSGSSGGKTVTLALSPADAERLVFSQEKGRVWLGLHPSTNAKDVSTEGRTLQSVFK